MQATIESSAPIDSGFGLRVGLRQRNVTLRPSHGFAGFTSTLVPLTDTRRSTNVYVGAAVGDRLGTGTLVGLIVVGFLVGARVGDRLGCFVGVFV